MKPLTAFEQTLLKLDTFLRQNELDYIVIGGIAVMCHLDFRTTRDIDISLCLDLAQIRTVGEKILNHFDPVHNNALEFFEQYFVLPVSDPATNLRIDISAGLGGFEQIAVRRGKRIKFSDIEINVCSVEDLIIFKLVAARPIDLADVELLIQKYLPELEQTYLMSTANEFSHLERSDIRERLEVFVAKYSA